MPNQQLARGLWAQFATQENPFGVANGMEQNLRHIDDHLALYTLLPPQAPGTPLPGDPFDGDGQAYTDGSYATFNGGTWCTYAPRKGIRVVLAGGTESWLNTGTGWEQFSVVDTGPAVQEAVAAATGVAQAEIAPLTQEAQAARDEAVPAASAAQAARVAAEAARDAAFVNASVHESIAAGLAAAIDGQQFQVAVDDEIIRYVRTNSTTATEVARYPSASVAGVIPQQARIYEFSTRDTFVSGAVQGALSADMKTISNMIWSIDGNGAIDVTGNATDVLPRLFWTGFERKPGKPLRAKIQMSFENTLTTCRSIIAIGTPGNSDSMHQYIVTQNGSLALQITASSTTVFSYSMSNAGFQALKNNEIVTLTIAVDGKGDGYLYAETASSKANVKLTGVPAGCVFAGSRTHSLWKLHAFSAEVKNVFEPVASPFTEVLTETNVLPSDLTKGEPIDVGGALENVWRSLTLPVSVVNFGAYKGVSVSTSLRTYIPIAPRQHSHASYHLRIETLIAGNSSVDDRFVLIQQDINGVEIVRNEVYLAGRNPSEPIRGVVVIDSATARLLFFIGVASPGRAITVSQASLALTDTVGFRPFRSPVLPPVEYETVALLGYSVIPDSTPNRNPKGFTCTGLDRIPTGDYAGCWIVSDDGRLSSGDGSQYAPKVHVITPDWRTILRTFTMPYTSNSIQGIAIDTSGVNDTFWVATAGDLKLRHFNLYGANAGVEIAEDVFDWVAAGYDSTPNGLAYDPINDALWVGSISGSIVRLISCNSTDLPRLLNNVEIYLSVDQMHFDAQNGLLYYSRGANGSNGSVYVHRLTDGSNTLLYSGLQHAQAIEGIFIDRNTSVLTVVCDGGFHIEARPELNIALQYRIPLIS